MIGRIIQWAVLLTVLCGNRKGFFCIDREDEGRVEGGWKGQLGMGFQLVVELIRRS